MGILKVGITFETIVQFYVEVLETFSLALCFEGSRFNLPVSKVFFMVV